MKETRSIRRSRLALLPALVLFLCLPVTALADAGGRIDEGMRLFEEEVDYAGALQVFLAVLEDDSAAEEHRQKARLQASFCLVAMDRDEEARTLLVEALMIDPDYELPPYSSPKLVEALENARAEAGERQADAELEQSLAALDDPVAPVTSVAPAPASKSGRLWPWSAALGGTAVAALGAGAYFGLSANSAQDRLINDPSSFDSQSQALEFREAAMGQARTANWLFISGAVLAVGSGAILALDGPRVAAAPTPDGLMALAVFDW